MKTGSFVNKLYAARNTEPTVGMGATILMWTDRIACTVIWVSQSGKALTVQRDRAIRTDSNGMSDAQSYRYEPDPDSPVYKYTLRSNGRWVRSGESASSGGRLKLGTRDQYHDFSF